MRKIIIFVFEQIVFYLFIINFLLVIGGSIYLARILKTQFLWITLDEGFVAVFLILIGFCILCATFGVLMITLDNNRALNKILDTLKSN